MLYAADDDLGVLVVQDAGKLLAPLNQQHIALLQHEVVEAEGVVADRAGVCPEDRSGDIEVLAVTPRASGAGASIEIVARRADGTVEPLSVVPRYEPAYPMTYRFRTSVRLRTGTVIDVRSSSPDCTAELDFIARQ